MGSGHMLNKSQGHIQLLGENDILFLLLTLAMGELLREGSPSQPWSVPVIAQTSELLFRLWDPISAGAR